MPSWKNDPPMQTLYEMEREYIFHVLEAVEHNKTAAARILGCDRRTLYRKLEAYRPAEGSRELKGKAP